MREIARDQKWSDCGAKTQRSEINIAPSQVHFRPFAFATSLFAIGSCWYTCVKPEKMGSVFINLRDLDTMTVHTLSVSLYGSANFNSLHNSSTWIHLLNSAIPRNSAPTLCWLQFFTLYTHRFILSQFCPIGEGTKYQNDLIRTP